MEEAQEDLKASEGKFNRKSKTLIDLVNARNGELTGDGDAAARRLISRQFLETFNVAVASLHDSTGVRETWKTGHIYAVALEVCTDQYV